MGRDLRDKRTGVNTGGGLGSTQSSPTRPANGGSLLVNAQRHGTKQQLACEEIKPDSSNFLQVGGYRTELLPRDGKRDTNTLLKDGEVSNLENVLNKMVEGG